jgi:hypothetical protein
MLGDAHIYDMPYKIAVEMGHLGALHSLDKGELNTYRLMINAYASRHPVLGTAVLYWKSRFRPQMCTWKQIHDFDWGYTNRDAYYIVSPTSTIDIANVEPFVEDFKWKEIE